MKDSHLEGDGHPSAGDSLSPLPDANGEPHTLLGAPIQEVCAGLALRDTFRALFDGELRGSRVGWPRLAGGGRDHTPVADPRARLEQWLREGDVLVELARSLPRDPFELGIVLPATVAVQLSDRLLGAPSSSGLASRVGVPSDAECGVLAYAAARLVDAHAGGWLVRDVRQSSLVDTEELVLWPIAIDTTVGALELTLCLSAALAKALPAVALHTLLHDSLGTGDAPSLAVGEVWISDRLPLTHTSFGLTGPVTLRVPDCEQLFAARLTEHHVACTPTSARPTPAAHDIELQIAATQVDFWALAALASGARCFIGEVGRDPVWLRRGGQTIARGELVVWRGALGVRITAV